MSYLKPGSWVGWTAVVLVVILAIVAGVADGAHRLVRGAAWLLVVVVAAVALFNESKGG